MSVEYTSEVTSQLVDVILTTNILQANLAEVNILSGNTSNVISLQASLLPNVANVYTIGSPQAPLHNIDSYAANITVMTINNLVPQNSASGNIYFYGNLIPSIDNNYYIGLPDKRWKHAFIDTLTANAATLIDNSTIIQDDVFPNKQFRFEANLLANGLTVFTMPAGNLSTTLVGDDRTQTLTNKTIVGSINYVGANELKTTGAPVVVSGAQPPTVGQVLVALSPTVAEWQSPNIFHGISVLNGLITNTQYFATGTAGIDFNIVSSGDTHTFNIPLASPTVEAGLISNSNQTIINKTIVDTGSNIYARALWSGTTPISTYQSQPPVTGQVLVATSSTTAIWETIPGFIGGNIIDNSFIIKDDADLSKQFRFEANALSSGLTVFTMPAGNTQTTLVGTDRTQTLTNKTIVGPTNYVGANELKTTGDPVVVSSAIPPVSGQVLVATTPTSADWVSIPGFVSGNIIDNTFIIKDDADLLKQFRFEANALSEGLTIFTMPAGNTNTTLVGTDRTQSLTNKNITGPTNTVRATQLSTTGNDVMLSGDLPPAAGQVLTAVSSTVAQWQSVTLSNNIDFQKITSNSVTSTTSSNYVDLDTATPFTLTTSNTGTSTYLIIFSSTCSSSIGNQTASFIINVNGSDISDSEKTVDIPISVTKEVIMTHTSLPIANGQMVKVRYKTTTGTLNVYTRVLSINGAH